MAQVSETCSCGAQFTWISKDAEYAQTAVEGWRAGHRHVIKPEDDGFRPAGGNTASVERKSDSTPHELDAETGPLWRYSSGISLKWHQS